MQDQAVRQFVVTSQAEVDPNQMRSPVAFFDADGNQLDVAALFARVAALETP
jgi:hypothetical protein